MCPISLQNSCVHCFVQFLYIFLSYDCRSEGVNANAVPQRAACLTLTRWLFRVAVCNCSCPVHFRECLHSGSGLYLPSALDLSERVYTVGIHSAAWGEPYTQPGRRGLSHSNPSPLYSLSPRRPAKTLCYLNVLRMLCLGWTQENCACSAIQHAESFGEVFCF